MKLEIRRRKKKGTKLILVDKKKIAYIRYKTYKPLKEYESY